MGVSARPGRPGGCALIINDVNPVLHGWGNYFRTGNAAQKFIQIDTYAWWRLNRFMVKRKGRNLRPGDR